MKLPEWTEKFCLSLVSEQPSSNQTRDPRLFNNASYVFFYTPLCGTCKVGEKMLEVIYELNPVLAIGKCNINFSPHAAQQWLIESVPCLVSLSHGQIVGKRYRLNSVQDLLQWVAADN